MQATIGVGALAVLAGAAMGQINVVDTTAGTATLGGTINMGEYVGSVAGNGATGFGGPVGNSTLLLDSDASTFNFALQNLGDISNNGLRIYLDVVSGGFNEISPDNGFVGTGDFSAASQIANPAASGVALPFAADFGINISPAFGGGTDPGLNGGNGPFVGLFELTGTGTGVSAVAGGLSANPDPIGEFPNASNIEFSIDLSTLGIAAGDTINLVALYGNNDVASLNTFLSNESYGIDLGPDNPGTGDGSPIDIPNFISFQTVPTPGSIALLGLSGLAAARRRR